jgi:predicted Zn-dependent protease
LDNRLLATSDDAWAHFVYGQALFNMNDVAGAEAAFRRAFELSPAYTAYGMSLGRALRRQGKEAEAKEVIQRTVEACSDPAQLEGWKADIEWAEGHNNDTQGDGRP